MEPTSPELQFSSSVAKLLHHPYSLQHPLRPITLQLALTDKCNLNCDFCSVKNRDGKELTVKQISRVLNHRAFSRLRGVEITGAGEPTLFGGLGELIFILDNSYGLDVGLITNGVELMKRVDQHALSLLTWLRISLNCLDYLDGIDLVGLPPGPVIGFSYVLNDRTTQEIIDKIADYANRHVASYVRIVPDCLAPIEKIAKLRTDLNLGYPNFYIQSKVFGSLTPVSPCRMGYLKPYLNSDGYFYWCSGVCLEERRFPEKYRMGRFDDVIWERQQPAFHCEFPKCFWVEHNRILELANTPVIHESFL